MTWWIKHRLQAEAGEGDAGSAGAAGAGADGGAGAAGAGDDAGDGGAASDQGTWPSDWRARYAKGDEKKASRLSRYASPEAAFDAMIAAQNRINSGELKSALPKDATPEQQAQWRAENGIPEAPDKYELKFDDGFVIGEDDKPMIDGFLKAAHGSNYTGAQAKAAVRWFYDEMARQGETREASRKEVEKQVEDALRAEWGTDYRATQNTIGALLDANLPAEDAELRTLVLNGAKQNAKFAKFLASLALQVNPLTTITPRAGGDLSGSIEDEISAIEKTMREKRDAYNRDEKMQKRYRDLLDARARHGDKAKRVA